MSDNTARRKGKANGRKRIKARTLKRTLDAWELYQKDWSQGRIAEALGITQPAVSQILNRTYREMAVDVREIAAHELVKELERCRQYAEANMGRAKTDPRVADTLLRWMERKDRLLGLGVTKHELSAQIHHTTNLGFDLYSSDDLACLEYLIAKGSSQPYDTTKKVCLIDSAPVPALTYNPQPVETFIPDDDIPLDGRRSKLQ